MAKKALVVVESPSKAKTIQKYLGREFVVKASVGHIRDLPKSKLGVDPKKGFDPDYQIIPGKQKIIDELRKHSQAVPELYLATDPDREGEAIAWHVQQELKEKGKKVHRVLFNSITKPAILEAMKHPQKVDSNKVNAQQARRILDRLVGYKISPLLWDKVKRGLSAGRVQSVALRLIVDREAEIKKFIPEEYWSVEGIFSKDRISFPTRLFKVEGADPELPNEKTTRDLLRELEGGEFVVESITQKERSRRPTPPFITSRMQQEASRKLGFSAARTMALAQRLYEGKDLGDYGTTGLITYMRTDSVRVEPAAIQMVRDYIGLAYGKKYLPEEPIHYKTKKSAQDAHEAIRPTAMELTPEKVQPFLEKDEYRLYQLIWNRFVASQMVPAVYDQTAVDLVTTTRKKRKVVFRASGSVMKFDGFTAVYLEEAEESYPKKGAQKSESEDAEEVVAEDQSILKLPPLKEGDGVKNESFEPHQHFTQPPPRYSDASLIRELEEKGIGRPSTYATILSNLQDREYVEKREARYYPSELGQVVTELLVGNFPDILNVQFTADMENQLDAIEEGERDWVKTLKSFWGPFEKTLEQAKKHMKNLKVQEVPTDIPCDKCGHVFVIKWGKMGSFLACSHYPDCKNTQDFTKDDQGKIQIVPKEYTDKKCDRCGSPMVVKRGKFGQFLACSDYPNCKTTMPMTIGVACPLCKEGELCERQSRYKRLFYSCNKWPGCTFAIWDKPIKKICPQCQSPILTEKITKRQGLLHKCPNKECGYIEIVDPNYGK